MSAGGPPRLARALLRLLLHPRTRDPILGDLAEEYARLEAEGRGARRWYWRQLIQSVGPSLRYRSRRGPRTAERPEALESA